MVTQLLRPLGEEKRACSLLRWFLQLSGVRKFPERKRTKELELSEREIYNYTRLLTSMYEIIEFRLTNSSRIPSLHSTCIEGTISLPSWLCGAKRQVIGASDISWFEASLIAVKIRIRITIEYWGARNKLPEVWSGYMRNYAEHQRDFRIDLRQIARKNLRAQLLRTDNVWYDL